MQILYFELYIFEIQNFTYEIIRFRIVFRIVQSKLQIYTPESTI